ncbi:MAG: ABC transporter ATP-binding protein [Crocinitomicaceae bacterium]|nr:ABC transporter ATP-binding protein [Crocinitomicaceae bacterium]
MAGQKEIALKLENVRKTFVVSNKTFLSIKDRLFNLHRKNEKKTIYALKNVNLEVHKGECIGIVGRNGSGKSTLTKIMSGAFQPDKGGKVIRNGTHLLMNLGVGFSHELTARENVYVNGSTLGLTVKQIDEIFHDIIQFAELEEFVDTKIKYFSSGMVQRLSFSIAMYAQADILFLDEVFAVGDNKFKEKATEMLEKSWMQGCTTIMVSHSNALIQKYCSKVLVLNKGEQIFYGDVKEGLEIYEGL